MNEIKLIGLNPLVIWPTNAFIFFIKYELQREIKTTYQLKLVLLFRCFILFYLKY